MKEAITGKTVSKLDFTNARAFCQESALHTQQLSDRRHVETEVLFSLRPSRCRTYPEH